MRSAILFDQIRARRLDGKGGQQEAGSRLRSSAPYACHNSEGRNSCNGPVHAHRMNNTTNYPTSANLSVVGLQDRTPRRYWR